MPYCRAVSAASAVWPYRRTEVIVDIGPTTTNLTLTFKSSTFSFPEITRDTTRALSNV